MAARCFPLTQTVPESFLLRKVQSSLTSLSKVKMYSALPSLMDLLRMILMSASSMTVWARVLLRSSLKSIPILSNSRWQRICQMAICYLD